MQCSEANAERVCARCSQNAARSEAVGARSRLWAVRAVVAADDGGRLQRRRLHWTARRPAEWSKEDGQTKAEQTLQLLKDEVHREQQGAVRLVAASDGAVDKERPATLWKRVRAVASHYYHGFRLLVLEVRLSSKYLWRQMRGSRLSRREQRQLVRTASDVFRLVPFLVFVIVPFMEFLLPVALWLFPNMLPSTFQERSKEEEKLKRQLKLKLEMAKFLQATIEEIALERKKSDTDEKVSKAIEFAGFMKTIRSEGMYVSNAELLRFSKLFEDELTLENLSIPQLRALCRIVGISPSQVVGTPTVLRFQLNLKLRELRADDREIASEGGVEALSTAELQTACRARGMRALGLPVERLQLQLREWLELSLNDKVPSSLLLLSRTLFLPEEISFTDRLKRLFSDLPDSIADEMRLKLSDLEGGAVDNRAKLELIQSIEAVLKRERVVSEQAEKEELGRAAAALVEATVVRASEPVASLPDSLPDGMGVPPADDAPVLEAAPSERISSSELEEIEDILHEAGGALHEERADLTELKEHVQDHKEDVEEVNEILGESGRARVSKASRRLQRRVDKMIFKMDGLMTSLKSEQVDLKTAHEGDDQALPPDAQTVADDRRSVMIDELLQSLSRLKKVPDVEKVAKVAQVLKALDDDSDGAINVELALEVIELLATDNVQINSKLVAKISEMLRKEDRLEGKADDAPPSPPSVDETVAIGAPVDKADHGKTDGERREGSV